MSKSTSPPSSQSTQSATPKPILAAPPEPLESSPSDHEAAESFAQYGQFKHYASLTFIFLAPALIAIPPRKLDFYTFSLAGAWTLSANQLISERYQGRGVLRVLAEGRTKRPQAEDGEGVSSMKATSSVEAEKMREPFTKIRKDGQSGPTTEVTNKIEESDDDEYWGFIKQRIKEVWRVDDTGDKGSKG